jgi:hypothetical protein
VSDLGQKLTNRNSAIPIASILLKELLEGSVACLLDISSVFLMMFLCWIHREIASTPNKIM